MTDGFGLIGLLLGVAIVAILAVVSLNLINSNGYLGSGSNAGSIINQAEQVKEQAERRSQGLNPNPQPEISIQADYGTRLIYTPDTSVDPDALKADCDSRGGEFNECGSPCAPDAEICITVCAYTCEGL